MNTLNDLIDLNSYEEGLTRGRREGIEEAAKVAEKVARMFGTGKAGDACRRIRDDIRALAEKQP